MADVEVLAWLPRLVAKVKVLEHCKMNGEITSISISSRAAAGSRK